MGRFKSRAHKAQDSIGLRYSKARNAIIEIRILLGLSPKSSLDDVVRGVKDLVGKKVTGNLRKELERLEVALEERGGRGVMLAERIDELRAKLEEEERDD